jgi:hypothetical protein
MGVLAMPERISIPSLSTYLRATGWQDAGTDARASNWRLSREGTVLRIALPVDPDVTDYGEVIVSALKVVAYVERRSIDEVAADVLYGGADIVSVRLTPDAPSGEAPLPVAEAAVKALKALVIGSASSLHYGGPFIPQRRPRAQRYSEQVRLSTSAGSFVVTLSLPLYERTPAASLLDMDEMYEAAEVPLYPFGRHVASRIRAVAETAVSLAQKVATSEEDLTVFEAEPMASGNATELSALGLLGGSPGSGYDLRFAPSPLVAAADAAPQDVHVSGDERSILTRASVLLRSLKPAPGIFVTGSIKGLSRESKMGPATVVIRGTVAGSRTEHRYHALVSEEQHQEAIRAYQDNLQVAARGDLAVRGNFLVLQELTAFIVQHRLPEA